MGEKNKLKEKRRSLIEIISKNKFQSLALVVLLSLFIFLRFYQIEERNVFAWDQVDNAWAAKSIIVDHRYPLVGMQARMNSGISVGPLYYYYVSIFYYLTNLDPIASGIAAGLTSLLTFFLTFFVVKKLLSQKVAIVAAFLHTVSYAAITADRIQWPVNFIFPLSLLIFYSLYKIMTGKPKFILLLVLALGLSFHIHFTFLFFPFAIFLSLPFFPKSKETVKYVFLSIPVILVFFTPALINLSLHPEMLNRNINFLNSYYHGLHLRRVLQLLPDAFIQFEKTLFFPQLKLLGWIILPLFGWLYLKEKFSREHVIFVYLSFLWLLIPWFLLSLYKGEITDYYFSMSSPVVLIVISYFFCRLLFSKTTFLKIVATAVIISYAWFNLQQFWITKNEGLKKYRQDLVSRIKKKDAIQFKEGIAESYLYYIYNRKHGKETIFY